jgi:glycosyltransferase involved in cell wall biosynthesis/2-polyprenyl-3-methyl-5-hydroxy-6-metoxy-1,4-benzoquinol methylase
VSQYSHLTVDLTNPNSSPTKIAELVGHGRTVLDVGCAHGHLAEVLTSRGCRVFGVERNAGDAARARAHCEQVVVADVEQPGWVEELRQREFDAVVLSDVLEHLRDPAGLLRRVRGLVRPDGGFVAASIPNVAHVSIRLELLLGSFRYEDLGILDHTHLRFYTRTGIEELFAACGFAVASLDCTTNEISEEIIASYLAKAGLRYTPELRERLGEFDAQAYQFIVKARPADGVRTAPAPVTKPLAVMEQFVREHQRLTTEHQRLTTEHQRLARENARLQTPPDALAEPRPGGLRVLQVIHQFLPRHTAGTEIYCSDLSFGLARRGHAIRVLSAAPWRDDIGTTIQWEGDQGVVVDRIPAGRAHRGLHGARGFLDRFDNPDARIAIRDVLDRRRPDVVHAQHLLYLSAELIPECRTRGIPVVVTLADYWFICHRVRLERRDGRLCEGPARGWNCCQCLNTGPLGRSHLNPAAVAANMYRYAYLVRQLNKADRILAPSAFLRDMMVRNGIDPGRIQHCDYGTVDPPASAVESFASRRLHEPVRFGFLGSFLHHKGVHVLIDAFNRLPPGKAELHLFGTEPDPGYAEALKRQARHDGIRWRGALPHDQRWKALAEIDVLVVSSIWYENSPLTIHEALVAGVPVIGSAMGGIPELVAHERTGLIYPALDAGALAACLRRVVDDPACVARWRTAIARPKTMEQHVEEIEGLYRELVSRPRPGRPRPQG